MAETSTSNSTQSTNPTSLGNLSTTAFPNESGEVVEPEAVRVLRIVIWSLASVATLVGNAIVLKATRELPGRIPLSYRLVSHLAVAEIINIISKQFVFVFEELSWWPFGDFICKVAIPLEVLSLFVITNTLAAISLNRFALIVLQYRVTISNRKVVLLFSLMWLYALAVVFPLFIYHELVDDPPYSAPFCKTVGNSKTYEIVRVVLNYGLPYVIMVLCYGAVAYKLKRHITREREPGIRMLVAGESTNRETAETDDREEEQEQEDRQAQQQHPSPQNENSTGTPASMVRLENDLLRMVYMIIVIFAVCYLPYQVEFLLWWFNESYREIIKPYEHIIVPYTSLVMVFPGALHPVCYGTMSAFYARAFSRLVLCRTTSE